MNTFVTVTQVSATKFEVEKVNAESQSRVRTKGILITCWESNQQNDKYCFELAEQMAKDIIRRKQETDDLIRSWNKNS